MRFAEFKSRALTEGARYGADNVVFLREFAQNARDAGASRIDIDARMTEGHLVLQFDDNGTGMSLDHAQKYLFTLYASSKEAQQTSAGHFGVGFWSVLLFCPDAIDIDTRSADGGFSVTLPPQGDTLQVGPPRRTQNGTIIRIHKRYRQDEHREINAIQAAVRRYCKYLRQNDGRQSPLAVWFNRERIDTPIQVNNSPFWKRFSAAGVEGAVGLGPTAGVELYVGGLPVWRGVSLLELQVNAPRNVSGGTPLGLSPYYVINADGLRVTLDRKAVYDNGALARVRSIAQRQMTKLVRNCLDDVAPPTLLQRMLQGMDDLLAHVGYAFKRHPGILVFVLVFVLSLGGIGTIPLVMTDTAPSRNGHTAIDAASGMLLPMPPYPGARSDYPGAHPPAAIAFDSDKKLYFKTMTISRLTSRTGASARPPMPADTAMDIVCDNDCITVTALLFSFDGGVPIPLPVPTGYGIIADSVSLSDSTVSVTLGRSRENDWTLTGDAAFAGRASFKAAPLHERADDTDWNTSFRYLQVPKQVLPQSIQRHLTHWRQLTSRSKQVEAVTNWVASTIAYDATAPVARAFDRFLNRNDAHRDWFAFVWNLGKGDCDVKNVFAIHLLRRLGIPSRLAVGYVGRGGRVISGRHAYIEYYNDHSWHSADATGQGAPTVDESILSSGPLEEDALVPPANDKTPDKAATDTIVSALKGESHRSSAPFSLWAITLWILGGCLVLTALAVVWRHRRHAAVPSPKHLDVAAGLLIGALEHPHLWAHSRGLLTRPLLPLVDGTYVSYRQAINAVRKGRLFYANRAIALAKQVAQSSACVVVDGTHTCIGDIMRRIDGATDLDIIDALRPTVAGDPGPPPLIAAADDILQRAGFLPGQVVACTGLDSGFMADIDCSEFGFSWKQLPPWFVAVSLDDDEASTFLSPRRDQPMPLVAADLVERLLDSSVILQSNAPALRREIDRVRRSHE